MNLISTLRNILKYSIKSFILINTLTSMYVNGFKDPNLFGYNCILIIILLLLISVFINSLNVDS